MELENEILTKIIKRRRSIFPISYTSQEIPVDVIEKVLESANYAPTHKMTQPWRFIVYRNEGKTKLGLELAHIYKETTPPEKFLQKKYDSIIEKFNQSNCVLAINAQLHRFGLFYMGYHREDGKTAVRTPMAEKVKWVDK